MGVLQDKWGGMAESRPGAANRCWQGRLGWPRLGGMRGLQGRKREDVGSGADSEVKATGLGTVSLLDA